MALHTLTESGHMAWTCLCGDERMAHISHEDVAHPTQDELETVADGSHIDEQGRIWTRSLTRPTGNTIIDASTIALPRCDCGRRTLLKVQFSDEELANVAHFAESGNPTNASVVMAQRHMQLARQLASAGKGPITP